MGVCDYLGYAIRAIAAGVSLPSSATVKLKHPLGSTMRMITGNPIACGAYAQMAERLKKQDQTLAGVQKVTLESRDAAQAVKQQTDPARYARHIEQELDKTIGRILDRLDVQHSNFEADRRDTAYRLEELVQQEENTLQRLRADQERAARWKKHIPFIALFGLVLALGLAIALPRILTGSGFGCGVLGGSWVRSTTEAEVCVFYRG